MSEETAWNFAQRFYAHPGLSPVLLQLQDDQSIDVPLVLVLLHAAVGGKVLDKARVENFVQQADEWQYNVIRPLRQVRRSLGSRADRSTSGLYEQVKAAELSAEEALIRRLAEALPDHGQMPPEAAAFENLDIYRRLLDRSDGLFDAVLVAFAAYRQEHVQ